MPQEHKKRGRRMNDKKRKHEDESAQPDEQIDAKRLKSDGEIQLQEELNDGQEGAATQIERPFYGMLDDDEQNFFRQADETLQADTFASAEDKNAFLDSLYKEADGKELKLANSQSCSRLMERLIKQSSIEQCKTLFTKFSGNFPHLMTHRFASHCCETLFQHAGPLVNDDLKAQPKARRAPDALKTLEQHFLAVLQEIQDDAGYLMTDPYASHGLRTVLSILSGRVPTPRGRGSHVPKLDHQKDDRIGEKAEKTGFTTPSSFTSALQSYIQKFVAGIQTDQIRALATHPHASPTIQVLLKLELETFGKAKAKDGKSIIRLLLPDEPIIAESGSVTFLNGMVYDPIGSHLVETIVQAVPGKLFKALYKEMLFERLPSYARNEIACHITCRVLERLGHDDLLDAHEQLIPVVSDLLRRNRTNVVRSLIERCSIRDIDTKAIAVQVNNTWSTPEGFEIQKLLKTDFPTVAKPNPESQAASDETSDQALPPEEPVTPKIKAQFNVLAQAMLMIPGSLSALVLDALIALDGETLRAMAYDPTVSRTLQAALTTRTSSIITTRKLVQHFYGHIAEMSLDASASHVVDCIWEGTHGLAFIRERLAEELAENESQLRESHTGRAVWRNWKMDIFKRRRGEWIRQSKVKASNDGFQSFSELDDAKDSASHPKTPLQLARERHARERREKEMKEKKEMEGNEIKAAEVS